MSLALHLVTFLFLVFTENAGTTTTCEFTQTINNEEHKETKECPCDCCENDCCSCNEKNNDTSTTNPVISYGIGGGLVGVTMAVVIVCLILKANDSDDE